MSLPVGTAQHQVRIVESGEAYRCPAQRSVLHGMEALRRKGIPVGCRNGGCGVCKVRVLSGDYRAAKMSRAVCTEAEQAQGLVLACKIYPLSDIEVSVVGKMARAIFAAPRPHSASSSIGFTTTARSNQPDQET